MTSTLGIDPGNDGAAVLMTPEKRIEVFRFKNQSESDISNWFASVTMNPCKAYLEKVHSMPGQGVASMFTFGKNFGFLRGVLMAYRIPFEDVPPKTWQNALSLGKTYPSRVERKRAHRERAQQWFPKLKITLAEADALLIAEYGYRLERILR